MPLLEQLGWDHKINIMKNLFFFYLFLFALAAESQNLIIGDRQFPIADIDSIDLESVDLEYVNTNIYITKSRFIPERDTTVSSSYNIPIPLVRRTSLQKEAFNTIWNTQGKFADAQMKLIEESDVEIKLVQVIDPLLTDLTQNSYLGHTNARFLDRYNGYYRLYYDFNENGSYQVGEIINIMINADTIPNLFQVEQVTDISGTFIQPVLSGISGTAYVLNADRLELRQLIIGDNRIKIARRGSGKSFFRKEKAVELRYLPNHVQTIPFRQIP